MIQANGNYHSFRSPNDAKSGPIQVGMYNGALVCGTFMFSHYHENGYESVWVPVRREDFRNVDGTFSSRYVRL